MARQENIGLDNWRHDLHVPESQKKYMSGSASIIREKSIRWIPALRIGFDFVEIGSCCDTVINISASVVINISADILFFFSHRCIISIEK